MAFFLLDDILKMAQQSEDVISAGYKYTWDSTSNSGISLKEYLEKARHNNWWLYSQ